MMGDQVVFQGKKYTIRFVYTSGMCELQEVDNPQHYELVSESEIKKEETCE